MSEFSVVTSAVEAMAARLEGISDGVAEYHDQVSTHASAAAQTPVDGALGGLMGHWAAVLPHFGLAGERLQAATRGAAAAYHAADASVADAAGGSEGP